MDKAGFAGRIRRLEDFRVFTLLGRFLPVPTLAGDRIEVFHVTEATSVWDVGRPQPARRRVAPGRAVHPDVVVEYNWRFGLVVGDLLASDWIE
jgi:hypothetical protein